MVGRSHRCPEIPCFLRFLSVVGWLVGWLVVWLVGWLVLWSGCELGSMVRVGYFEKIPCSGFSSIHTKFYL